MSLAADLDSELQISPEEKQNTSLGREGNSDERGLALHAWRPGFDPQNPWKTAGVAVDACDTRTGNTEKGRPLGMPAS